MLKKLNEDISKVVLLMELSKVNTFALMARFHITVKNEAVLYNTAACTRCSTITVHVADLHNNPIEGIRFFHL